MVGLDGLRVLFQPLWFYDLIIVFPRTSLEEDHPSSETPVVGVVQSRTGGEAAGLGSSSPKRMKCWISGPEWGQQALEAFPSAGKAVPGKGGVSTLFTRAVVYSSPFHVGWIRHCLQKCWVAAPWRRGSNGQ